MRKVIGFAALIGLGVPLGPVPPALAAPPDDLDALVTDFFVQADQAWYGTEPAAFTTGRAGNLRIAPAARHLAATTAAIARDARDELGLMADEIRTSVTNVETAAGAGRYEFASAVSTELGWNVGEMGDSVMADDYTVVVTREPAGWTVSQVTGVAPPAESPEPEPDPEEPPPCKPGEVCDGETRLGGLDLSGPRAKARAAQRAGKGKESVGRSVTGFAPSARTYDPSAAATYALYWSGVDAFDNPLYNSAYPRQNNNCTNFASQAMRAGGWNLKGGWSREDPNHWTYDVDSWYGPSFTWSISDWMRRFAVVQTDRATQLEQVNVRDAVQMWNMLKGDLLFWDWDPDGQSDGTIDHTMVVTGTFNAPSSPDFREPIISQNSNHRRNVPLYLQIKRATTPTWWGGPPEHTRLNVYSVRVNSRFTK